MTFESFSYEDTINFAKTIAQKAKAGDVYALNGDLGAGKTAFAKGFALGLSIETLVKSPTFTIVNEHEGGRLPLYHFDVYRIENPLQMEDTGYLDYFYGSGVCLVEWAQQIEKLLPPNAVNITITRNFDKGDDYRLIEIN